MKKLFLITLIFLLQSFPSYGKVGDGYICHPIKGIYSFGKDLMISKSESLSHPIHIEKFVWFKDAIQFNELKLTIPITIQTNETFESYDGYHKVSFDDGFMIWTKSGVNPIGFNLKTFNCKKF